MKPQAPPRIRRAPLVHLLRLQVAKALEAYKTHFRARILRQKVGIQVPDLPGYWRRQVLGRCSEKRFAAAFEIEDVAVGVELGIGDHGFLDEDGGEDED